MPIHNLFAQSLSYLLSVSVSNSAISAKSLVYNALVTSRRNITDWMAYRAATGLYEAALIGEI